MTSCLNQSSVMAGRIWAKATGERIPWACVFIGHRYYRRSDTAAWTCTRPGCSGRIAA